VNTVAADERRGWRWVDIGGTRWAVRELGPAEALEVLSPAGQAGAGPVRWPAWRYSDHIAALRAGLAASHPPDTHTASVDLDLPSYLNTMPAYATLDEATRRALLPVALWWAGGGDGVPATVPDAQGMAMIDGRPFALRRWSHRERLASLLSCLGEHGPGDGGGCFDAVAYLDAMVRRTVAPGLPGPELDELPACWALPLIEAVVALNVVRPQDEPLPGAGPHAQAAAAQTLRLCRALGWTPSQVWSAPAAEVDHLLALLDQAEPRPVRPAAAAPRRLADHPDAVVIRVDD